MVRIWSSTSTPISISGGFVLHLQSAGVSCGDRGPTSHGIVPEESKKCSCYNKNWPPEDHTRSDTKNVHIRQSMMMF